MSEPIAYVTTGAVDWRLLNAALNAPPLWPAQSVPVGAVVFGPPGLERHLAVRPATAQESAPHETALASRLAAQVAKERRDAAAAEAEREQRAARERVAAERAERWRRIARRVEQLDAGASGVDVARLGRATCGLAEIADFDSDDDEDSFIREISGALGIADQEERSRQVQCKDIPTEPILRFLAQHQGRWANWYRRERLGDGQPVATVALLLKACNLPPTPPSPTVRDAMPPDVPDKLALAKMRQLLSNGTVDGCPCGCRGDFEITDKGLAQIGEKRVAPMVAGSTVARA